MVHTSNQLDAERLDDILLSMVEGIGARTRQRLLKQFGNASAILDASRNDLTGFEFLKPDTLEQLITARKRLDPVKILDICEYHHIDIISLQDSRYPQQLRTISDPPPILYVQGTLFPSDVFSIAIVGTRHCTAYGIRQTERLTSALVQKGIAIVSGLAKGIDGIAHKTALSAGGRTLAVLGSGLCRIYPTEHELLAQKIIESGGCVMSEYPPFHFSAKWTFPQRNRIVSGLSLGVLVTEAPLRSGAMISARLAGEQGRDIFAVPGAIDSATSGGCHQLIRDGAYLVESADDILSILGPMRQPVLLPEQKYPLFHPNEVSLNDVEFSVLQHLDKTEKSLDSIAAAAERETHQVSAVLEVLERKRMIRQVSPSLFIRIQ